MLQSIDCFEISDGMRGAKFVATPTLYSRLARYSSCSLPLLINSLVRFLSLRLRYVLCHTLRPVCL